MIKVKKGNLDVLYLTVKGTEGVLTLKEARLRDQFMKHLLPATQEFEQQRKAIYEHYCEKNEDGTPNTTENTYKFPPQNVATVNEELKTLYMEEVELPVLMPDALMSIIERSTYLPKLGETEQLDESLAQLDPATPPPSEVPSVEGSTTPQP